MMQNNTPADQNAALIRIAEGFPLCPTKESLMNFSMSAITLKNW